MVTDINTLDDFAKAMRNTNYIIKIIDFYADWCQPCKIIAPKFDAINNSHSNIGLYRINVDNPALKDVVDAFNIESLPTFCFVNGEDYLDRVVGANMNKIMEMIDTLTKI